MAVLRPAFFILLWLIVAGMAPLSPALASTPTLAWAGAKRVNVLCNVVGGPGIDHLALTRQLCRDVTRLAGKGAPIPVQAIAIGDPAVLSSDAVTILVHASVSSHGRERLLAFNIRPYRTSTEQASVLFGAAPRVAPITGSGSASAALEAALKAALSETLPWQARRPGPQQIK